MSPFAQQRRRLGWMLAGIFTALAGASTVLIVQSFDRLRMEAFHLQRAAAEEVVSRIDEALARAVAPEEGRPPTDYDFLVVSGERYVQRSPLSSLTPDTQLPGLVGYFQVDVEGRFSTPLLPAGVEDPEALALTGREYRERRAFEERLRKLLEGTGAAEPAPELRGAADEAPLADRRATPEVREEAAPTSLFEQLSNAESFVKPSSAAGHGKVAELDFQESLAQRADERPSLAGAASAKSPTPTAEWPTAGGAQAVRRREVRQVTVVTDEKAPLTPRVAAFQSAVDPLSLALLDADHLVLYRKVWLDGQLIQGAVVRQDVFLDTLVGRALAGTSLERLGELVVAFENDVLRTYPPERADDPPGKGTPTLLLRTRLASPADAVELVFSVAALPLGPGAVALGWATLMMVLVLCGGCFLLFRLGRQHIRLAEQQQDFVSAVSHELKTPLTSIRMYAEILRAGWSDEPRRRTYYDYILSESERLSRLIGNVLQLARITRSTAPEVTLEPVPVGALLDQVRSKVSSLVEESGLTLELAWEPAALAETVAVDEDGFVQVMINLVDNAIKFSTDATRPVVQLACRVDGGEVEVAVRDHGPGVPPGQTQKIFRLFYRSGTELTRETAGTGIGLALVRELVSRMGGTVDVVNRDPGAEFRVRLPVYRGAS